MLAGKKTPQEKPGSLKEAIVDLYLNVKSRISSQDNQPDAARSVSERAALIDKDPYLILDYIRSSVEILANLRADDSASRPLAEKSSECENAQHDYEQMIQRLEEETRNHVRVEQQLNLHIEGLQSRLDEREPAKVQSTVDALTKHCAQLEEKRTEIVRLKQQLREALDWGKKMEARVKSLSVSQKAAGRELGKGINTSSVSQMFRHETKPAAAAHCSHFSTHSSTVGFSVSEMGAIQLMCNKSGGDRKVAEKECNAEMVKFYKSALAQKERELAGLRAKLADKTSLAGTIAAARQNGKSFSGSLVASYVSDKIGSYHPEQSRTNTTSEKTAKRKSSANLSTGGTRQRSAEKPRKAPPSRKQRNGIRPETACAKPYSESHKTLRIVENKLEDITGNVV